MSGAIEKSAAPDPSIAKFVERIADGAEPMEAAIEAGFAPGAARRLLQQPPIAAALKTVLANSYATDLLPLAYKAVKDILAMETEDPRITSTKARTALGIILASVNNRGADQTKVNPVRDLGHMSLDDLEAQASELNRALGERKAIPAQAEEVIDN